MRECLKMQAGCVIQPPVQISLCSQRVFQKSNIFCECSSFIQAIWPGHKTKGKLTLLLLPLVSSDKKYTWTTILLTGRYQIGMEYGTIYHNSHYSTADYGYNTKIYLLYTSLLLETRPLESPCTISFYHTYYSITDRFPCLHKIYKIQVSKHSIEKLQPTHIIFIESSNDSGLEKEKHRNDSVNFHPSYLELEQTHVFTTKNYFHTYYFHKL